MKKNKTDKELLRIRIFLTVGVVMLVIILALVFLQFPDNTDAHFTYTEESDGSITVMGYTGDVKSLTIPSEIDGYKVKMIGERAFGSHDSNLEKVIISDGIEEIGTSAFANCENLTKVELPSTLKTIGYQAFYNCSFLVDITLPDSLLTIDDEAFENCARLPRLRIPARVAIIGTDAFLGCSSLVLDVSENDIAKSVAKAYLIPTDYTDSGSFSMLIAVIVTVLSIALFIAVLVIISKLRSKKRNKPITPDNE